MSKILRSPSVTRVLLFTAVSFLAVGLLLFSAHTFAGVLACKLRSLGPISARAGRPWYGPVRSASFGRRDAWEQDEIEGRSQEGPSCRQEQENEPGWKGQKRTGAANGGQLTFSQDIAPILVANCVGCHSGDGNGIRRGKLDLSTFRKASNGHSRP